MSHDLAISAVGVWKRFHADRQRRLLRDRVQGLKARLHGERRGWRWALRDITLNMPHGESVALVGANGSGKTTLLKILNRVMYPYAGTVDVRGRVGALIEVRAGIHPDLTGRENIFLYGSLLGHKRQHVLRRLDEIVAFAELEGSVDRQVKFYSSGMQMRLGFSVAAFLEPDVLLVDEVLAVGDASFQQKCLDRMRMALSEGTTLVFVSHDLASVEATCSRGLWLQDGIVVTDGPIREVLTEYRQAVEETAEITPDMTGPIRLLKLAVSGSDGGPMRSGGEFSIDAVLDGAWLGPARLSVGISEGPASPIFLVGRPLPASGGQVRLRCEVPWLPLPKGRFFVWIGVFGSRGEDLLAWHPAAHFDVVGPSLDPAPRAIARLSPVQVPSTWEVG